LQRAQWQTDVETVHRLVERSFFDREEFRSVEEFWAKVTTCWWYFNLARPNRGEGLAYAVGDTAGTRPEAGPGDYGVATA